jgi:hypothetical protein
MNIKATPVFAETWEAIQAKNETGGRKYKLIEQVGGSRSSKTWSNFQVVFLYAQMNMYKTIVVMRDTAVDCRDKVENEFIKWLKDPNGRVREYEQGKISVTQLDEYLSTEDLSKMLIQNKSLHTWTVKESKSTISFTGTDDPDRSIGKSQDVLWVNEPYRFVEEVFIQLMQRTNDFGLVDWNPKQSHFIERQRKKENTITLRSTLFMNPFCPEESKKQILGYQPISMCAPVIDGRIERLEALTYSITENPLGFTDKELKEMARCQLNEAQETASKYHWSVYGLGEKAERPNRILQFNEISDERWEALDAEIYYGVDWGTVDPWGIVACKYYDGALYLKELNYLSENEWRMMLPSLELERIQGEEEGLVRYVFNKIGIPTNRYVICDNNREEKIRALRIAGWDNAIKASKGRVSAELSLLAGIKVYYTISSTNLAIEQENLSWKVDRYGITLEEPEPGGDHLIDPTRYILSFLKYLGVVKHV